MLRTAGTVALLLACRPALAGGFEEDERYIAPPPPELVGAPTPTPLVAAAMSQRKR